MDHNIFAGGTAPGSPNTKNEVKALICYLLLEMGQQISFEELHESLRENSLVNYFELTDSLNSLVNSQHIVKLNIDGIFYYNNTELGKKTAETLDDSISPSVRSKSLEAIRLVVARKKRLRETVAKITPLESGGYSLELSIPDHNYNLVSFTIFVPTKEEGEQLRLNFLNDPIFLYKAVMSLLSGDKTMLGELTPDKKRLFK